jgi:hypothetical protein
MQITKSEVRWNDSLSVTTSKAYLDYISAENGWLANAEGGLFIAYFIKRFPLFRMITFVCDVNSINGQIVGAEEKQEFLESLIRFVKIDMKIDMINQSPAFAIFEFAPRKSVFAPFGSYRIDLHNSEDELWSRIHGKHKNVIRNAIKRGVSVKKGSQYLNVAIDVVSQTLARSNLPPLNRGKIIGLAENIGENIQAYVCYYQEQLQGVAIFVYSRESAFYLWGGSIVSPLTGAINYLHWIAINDFKNEGVRTYDFVGGRLRPEKGSKIEGIQRFKSRFGSDFVTGYLWRYPINYKGRIFRVLYTAYNYLRGRKTNDIIDDERAKKN